MNLVDRVVNYFSPVTAEKRFVSRKKLEFMQRYEGASRSHRAGFWETKSTSANTEIRQGAPLLRARARDLVRNDPWAARAKSVIVNNTIGSGIMPSIRIKSQQASWSEWAQSTTCDYDGVQNFYGIQSLVMGSVVEAGEVFVRRIFTRKNKFGLALQVLESEHLDHTKDGDTTNGFIIQGKEYNALGELTHYHLFSNHPGEQFSRSSFQSDRVPAKDVLHIYRQDRPSQVRGVTWFAPLIAPMLDFAEYEDAQLVKQKISSKWTAFVYDNNPVSSGDQHEMSSVMQAGGIEFLPPGKDIRFPDMPDAGQYSDFAKSQLHKFAAGIGVTYESLTGYYDDTNFASGRMGFVEMHRNIDSWRRMMIIPLLCRPVMDWLSEASLISGISAPRNTEQVEWTPPRREMFNPKDETAAQGESVLYGFKSLSGVLRENGYNPEKVFEEIASDQKRLDDLGLTLKSDYRTETNKGNINAAVSD